jgi:hypothetical protein
VNQYSLFDQQAVRTAQTDLHCVEVQVCLVAAGGHRASSTTTHADAVGRATNLHHKHANLAISLLQVAVVNLANATTAQKCSISQSSQSVRRK